LRGGDWPGEFLKHFAAFSAGRRTVSRQAECWISNALTADEVLPPSRAFIDWAKGPALDLRVGADDAFIWPRTFCRNQLDVRGAVFEPPVARLLGKEPAPPRGVS
jgi:hypothetical protein